MTLFRTLFTLSSIVLTTFAACATAAENSNTLSQSVGGARFENWSGLGPATDGAVLKVPGEAVWRYPDGPRHVYKQGFRIMNDNAADWHGLYGLQFEARLDADDTMELSVALTPETRSGLGAPTTARATLRNRGWHTVTLPWSAFEAPGAQRAFLLSVKEVRIAARPLEKTGAPTITLRNVRAIKAPLVSLETDVCGKSGKVGSTVEYAVNVGNVTSQQQSVTLSFSPYGWEAMSATVEPKSLVLAPDQTSAVTVRVQVPDRVPPGGHERQVLQAVANGDAARAAKLTFVTACELPHPNILHTSARWDEVRAKVKQFDWAKKAQDDLVAKAEITCSAIRLTPGW